jgi:type IV pilus assembly protein PilB
MSVINSAAMRMSSQIHPSGGARKHRKCKKQSIIHDLLLRSGVVDAVALERAADVQSTGGISLPRALVSLGYVREDAITATIAHGLNLEHLGPDPPPVPPEAYDLLPAAFCRQRKVTPLSNNDRVFRLAIVDPLDYFTIQDVEFRTRKQVACVVTDESTLEDLIQKIYGKRLEPDSPTVAPETAAELEMRGEDENYDLGNEAALASNANMPPVVKLVNQFIGRAVKSGASDIHVEPQEDFLQVRQRVDGNLQDLMRIPRDLQDATLSRLKIMAGMDIADRRRPQDGRARVRYNAKFLDLRVSTLPTQYGEKVVLRILDSGKQQMPIEALGLSPSNLDVLQSLLFTSSGNDSGHRPDGQRQDLHALYLAQLGAVARQQHHHCGRPHRIPPGRDQSSANQHQGGSPFCRRSALDLAPGSQHHHGGRNSGPRNGGDCRGGFADRPPVVQHSAYQ